MHVFSPRAGAVLLNWQNEQEKIIVMCQFLQHRIIGIKPQHGHCNAQLALNPISFTRYRDIAPCGVTVTAGVRSSLGLPCCILEQHISTSQKLPVILRKRWLRPNITEKLLTGI